MYLLESSKELSGKLQYEFKSKNSSNDTAPRHRKYTSLDPNIDLYIAFVLLNIYMFLVDGQAVVLFIPSAQRVENFFGGK